MVSCTVDPVQCTEGHDVEQEINVPITHTKDKLRGRSWCFFLFQTYHECRTLINAINAVNIFVLFSIQTENVLTKIWIIVSISFAAVFRDVTQRSPVAWVPERRLQRRIQSRTNRRLDLSFSGFAAANRDGQQCWSLWSFSRKPSSNLVNLWWSFAGSWG